MRTRFRHYYAVGRQTVRAVPSDCVCDLEEVPCAGEVDLSLARDQLACVSGESHEDKPRTPPRALALKWAARK